MRRRQEAAGRFAFDLLRDAPAKCAMREQVTAAANSMRAQAAYAALRRPADLRAPIRLAVPRRAPLARLRDLRFVEAALPIARAVFLFAIFAIVLLSLICRFLPVTNRR